MYSPSENELIQNVFFSLDTKCPFDKYILQFVSWENIKRMFVCALWIWIARRLLSMEILMHTIHSPGEFQLKMLNKN